MKKSVLIISILSALCVQLGTYAAINYDSCKKHYTQRNFSAARDCSKLLINSNPSDVQARYLYATSMIYTREYSKALEEYKYIIKKYPSSPAAKLASEQIILVNNKKSNAAAAPKKDSDNYFIDLKTTKKWGSMPIKVWVEPSKYAPSVLQAFSEWQYSTKNTVKFTQISSEDAAMIKVYFVDKLPSSHSDEKGECKITSMGGYLQEVKIYLLDKSSDNKELPSSQIFPCALHQIGHAIGIDGHSSKNTDVMNKNNISVLGVHTSRRDINTVKAIYKK